MFDKYPVSVTRLVLAIFLLLTLSSCGLKDEHVVSGHPILAPKTNVILALFDGSENKTIYNNEIVDFLEEPLEKFGFQVQYHDINTSPPPQYVMRNIRAIITWFNDSSMKKAGRYCQWLKGQLEDGKKLIIIDNFGAYQDSKTLEWTPMHIVNNIFKQIGVLYKAKWTDNPELLQITYKEPSIVEKEREIDLSKSAHYYLFGKIDEEVVSFLTISRKDLPQSESQVVFSHPNGGMALSRYILTEDKETGHTVSNIEFSRFLQESLFFTSARSQKTLIVWDKAKDKNNRLIKNAIKTFEYAKVDFDIAHLKDLERFLAPDFNQYTSIVFYADRLWLINKPKTIADIKQYVAGGGGILIAERGINQSLLDLLGIEKFNDFYKSPIGGLKITKEFFPGAHYIFHPDLNYNVLDVELKKDVDTFAVALDKDQRHPEGIPIAWRNKYGEGTVVFWNCDFFDLHEMRGLFLQSLLLTQPVSIHSLAGIENIHIDDFPQPMYNIYREPVKTTYNMVDTDFYLNVWWKDILNLAKKYNLHYTCYTIFNYDGKTRLPFDGRDFEYGINNAFREFVKRIIDNNFELGLHGYNHQSLTIKPVDYRGWQKKKYMVESLKQADVLWKEVFPLTEAPFSYVAPMNVIDRSGTEALAKTFPTIKVISKYYSQEDEGVRYQEFGPDLDSRHFFNIPRITGGYVFDQERKNMMINALNTFGIWTHFIHPGDVFGEYAMGVEAEAIYEEKNAKDWGSLLRAIDSWFEFVRKEFPWLRNMTTKEAYHELSCYLDYKVRVEIKDNALSLLFTSGSDREKLFSLRINDGRKIANLENCQIIHAYPDLNIYILQTQTSKAKIELINE
jgi:hypothetical protein